MPERTRGPDRVEALASVESSRLPAKPSKRRTTSFRPRAGWRRWQHARKSPGAKALKEMVGASGFEPPTSWSRTFCTRLHVFANYPYGAVFLILLTTSRLFALHRLVAVCRLSMHEKGKKRAKSVKCLIPGSLVGTDCPASRL